MARTKKRLYEFFSVSTDILVLRPGPKSKQRLNPRPEILLIQRKFPPYQSCWALPGGFVDREEGLENAARRELFEETGLRPLRFYSFGAYGKPGRDPRGRTLTVAFLTKAPKKAKASPGDDAADAKWFSVDKLPKLAFDHREIIRNGVSYGRQIKFYVG